MGTGMGRATSRARKALLASVAVLACAAAIDVVHAPAHAQQLDASIRATPGAQMLLEAAPRMDGFGREVAPPEGEIPDPINPPPGCAFHPRCPLAGDICRQERPEMRRIGTTRVACHMAEG